MIKREDGFTMVELLVTMVIFTFTIVAASTVFVSLLNQFKQQSKLAETNIEGMIGLEILRRDIELAGYGLPWVLQSGLTTGTYLEASDATTEDIPKPNTYNDGNPNLDPPRGILSDNDVVGLGLSDYLVIKSTAVAANNAAGKYTDILGTGGGGTNVKVWNNPSDDLINGDRTIVLIPARGETQQRILVNNGDAFTANFAGGTIPAAYAPGTAGDLYLIYGVDPDTNLRMPFNRADYYIRRVTGTNIPQRCAQGTGILMKSVIEHASGNRGSGIPLLDCVADMQVAFDLDTDGDGDVDSTGAEDLSALDAQQIREQVKAVRVYILAHEGQRDRDLSYRSTLTAQPIMCVGEGTPGACSPGKDYDLTTIPNYDEYRWKLYTLVVHTKNLRQ